MRVTAHQRHADVIVVGGGPAGCTVARMVACHGLRTLLFESKRYPRHKTCAGVLSAKAFPLLPPDCESVLGEPLYGVEFRFRNERPVCYKRETAYARMVDRQKFDHFLAQKAVESGAVLLEASPVLEVWKEGELFGVSTENGSYYAPVLVGSDGANGVVRKALGFGGLTMGFGLEVDLSSLDRLNVKRGIGLIDYGVIPWGYGWVFPREGGFSVGIGSFARLKSSLRGYFRSYIGYLSKDDPDGLRLFAHPIPLGGRGLHVFKDNCLLVGDAAGFVDPFFGEGIYYAILSGSIAAKCIAKGELDEYPSVVNERITRELGKARLLARVFYSAPRFFHDWLVRKRRVIEAFLKTVSGESSYGALGRWLLKCGGTELIRLEMSDE